MPAIKASFVYAYAYMSNQTHCHKSSLTLSDGQNETNRPTTGAIDTSGTEELVSGVRPALLPVRHFAPLC